MVATEGSEKARTNLIVRKEDRARKSYLETRSASGCGEVEEKRETAVPLK